MSSLSLHNCAVLVSVNSSMPQMTAKDATATHIAEEAMNAENIGRYTKDLYPKALTAPIKNYIQALRLLVGKYGVPYGRNQWIVPNSMRLDLFNAAQQTQKQFSLAVDAFIINFGQVLYAAQQKQGDMFATRQPCGMSLSCGYRLHPCRCTRRLLLTSWEQRSSSR